MDFLPILVIAALAVGIYFIPTWVSSVRKHHNANAIFVTNLLLGWTFLGWAVALIWACTEVKSSPDHSSTQDKDVSASGNNKCLICAEIIKADAIKCRYCGTELSKKEEPIPPAIFRNTREPKP